MKAHLQIKIFRGTRLIDSINLYKMEQLLKSDTSIPDEVIQGAVKQLQANLPALGLDNPSPALIIQWLTGILAQNGHSLDELPSQSLELSLENIEMNMLNPAGSRDGVEHAKTPEATSLIISKHIKSQVALRRVFQPKVVEAHQSGLLDLTHLGSVDRPHDIFLTPEYIKLNGLPAYSSAPQAGPAVNPDVLLSHLARFTHELQNHFAGTVQWGFFNTLLLPFLKGKNARQFRQFAQHLLFEFAQLDVGRGGLSRKVILDFDIDVPPYLESIQAIGPKGEKLIETYGSMQNELNRLNKAILDVLEEGDYRGCPFYAPQIVFHFNRSDTQWNTMAQRLFKVAFKYGNPTISFSQNRRFFGPVGTIDVHDPDWIKQFQKPECFRGFSLSSLSINLPRLLFNENDIDFDKTLDHTLEITLSAHREKRIFISNLMSKGLRGPHQFLRHKVDGIPFLKLEQGTLVTSIVGLAEAAALSIGSPKPEGPALARTGFRILETIRRKMDKLSDLHKLNMQIGMPVSEEVACRFAKLDFQKYGSKHSGFLLKRDTQTESIYSTGPNILFDKNLSWNERLKLESPLHLLFNGSQSFVLYSLHNEFDDTSLFHKIYKKMREHGLGVLQPAPDMLFCVSCSFIFNSSLGDSCPHCHKTQLSHFGLGQSRFSPVQYWCRGKKEEWNIRHRFDEDDQPMQELLPLF